MDPTRSAPPPSDTLAVSVDTSPDVSSADAPCEKQDHWLVQAVCTALLAELFHYVIIVLRVVVHAW